LKRVRKHKKINIKNKYAKTTKRCVGGFWKTNYCQQTNQNCKMKF